MKAKRTKIIRFISVFLFLCIVFSITAGAEQTLDGLIDRAGQFALYNIENDRILLSKNIDRVIFPGSTVKLMSGLIICEKLGDRADEKVTVTASMLSGVPLGKSIGLEPGQSLTIKNLMYAAFSGGYNDAISVLAYIASGSTAKFVTEMNERAKQLGMSSTRYTNVTGFDSPSQTSTMRDIIKVAKATAQNGLYVETSSEYNCKITFSDGTSKTSYGTNETLNVNAPDYYCRSASGLNSGSTDEAGYCLATRGVYKNAEYLFVVTGCEENSTRFLLAKEALQYAYDNYGYNVLLDTGSVVGESPIDLSASSETATLVLTEDLRYFGQIGGVRPNLEYRLVLYNEKLTAPIKSGDTVGKYIAWYGDEIYGTADVTVKAEIEKNGFLAFMDAMKNYLTGRAFVATIIVGAVLAIGAVLLPKLSLIARQKKRRYVRHRGGFRLK